MLISFYRVGGLIPAGDCTVGHVGNIKTNIVTINTTIITTNSKITTESLVKYITIILYSVFH